RINGSDQMFCGADAVVCRYQLRVPLISRISPAEAPICGSIPPDVDELVMPENSSAPDPVLSIFP
uniref:Uncharacterized protein n=1 Tax=Aegilops tauschii subsp. strangulata TaxID=200361 RepID=A0A453NKC0_AEGTS